MHNKCNLALLHSGNTNLKVSAKTATGDIRIGSIGYADPCSTRNIFIGELKATGT